MMEFRLRFGFSISLILVMLMIGIMPCNCKAFGPLTSQSSADDVFNQVYDVATGKRTVKIKGNIFEGDAEISTSYTNEEIMELVAIGGGILLALVCCCVCFRYCCCPPNKRPTVIMYQQMPSVQPHPQTQSHAHTRTAMPGNNSMIPLRNQVFPVSHSHNQFTDTSPPPPYPGIPAQHI